MDVLGGPGEADVGAASGQAAALRLVGVRDEDGHAHIAGEADDDLRRRAEVDRALDLALDPRPSRAAPSGPEPEAIVSFSGRTIA